MRDRLTIWVPALLIFIAESFNFLGQVEVCQAVHVLNVLVCIFLPLGLGTDWALPQAYSLISIIRIVNIAIPRFFTHNLFNYVPVYAAAIIGAFVVMRESRTLREFASDTRRMLASVLRRERENPKRWFWLFGLGIFMSYLLANMEFQIIRPQALIPEMSLYWLSVLAIVMIVFVGFGEELMFRAILQRRLQTKLGIYNGIFLASALFAAMHAGYLNLTYLFYVFLVGLMLGLAYQWTKSLGLVSLVHGGINVFLFSFLPFGQFRLF